MPRDRLIHMKRLLAPGERLPRWAEREEEERREATKLDRAEEAREAEYQENESDRYARRDALIESDNLRADAEERRRTDERRLRR